MSSKHKKHKKRSGYRYGSPQPPLPGVNTERILVNLYRLIEDKQFHSLEEAQDYLASMTPEQIYEMAMAKPSATPAEQARDLVYRAWEADDEEDALALARRALLLDPACVDAMLLVNDLTAESDEEHLAGLRKAVDAAERALGPHYFRDHAGHFWGLHETRPYMRARLRLAEALKAAVRVDGALPHFEELLKLNPGDNQGVRDHLLDCYLFQFDYREPNQYLQQARDLMRRYPDHSAVFLWGAVLERVLSGDFPAAARALKRARSQNRFVEQYLSTVKPMEEIPEFYSPGDASESAHCVDVLGMAWIRQLPAFFYLQGALGEKAGKLPEAIFSGEEDGEEPSVLGVQ